MALGLLRGGMLLVVALLLFWACVAYGGWLACRLARYQPLGVLDAWFVSRVALGLLAVLFAYQLSTALALLILGGGFLWILCRYVIDKESTLDQAAPSPETQAVQQVAETQE
jgi:hypothetical protein